MTRATLLSILLLCIFFLWGCEDTAPTLEVYAASSLTEVFGDLERQFERANPDVDVSMSFAGSQVLRLQIEQGAPADIFASANPEHMDALGEAGHIREPQVFATNELVVIVPLDNPASIESFSDLRRAQRLVIGNANVPIGSYTRQSLLRGAGRYGADFETETLDSVVSEENNVRLVRAKVELGEADAAVVYRTDAESSDRVRVVPIPAELNVAAEYTIGVVDGTEAADLADRWLAFVRSAPGQATLARRGFSVTR